MAATASVAATPVDMARDTGTLSIVGIGSGSGLTTDAGGEAAQRPHASVASPSNDRPTYAPTLARVETARAPTMAPLGLPIGTHPAQPSLTETTSARTVEPSAFSTTTQAPGVKPGTSTSMVLTETER